jgi:hypothetical protein
VTHHQTTKSDYAPEINSEALIHRYLSDLQLDRVNEFYQKGCQEKNSPSTGGREDVCLEIQPTSL